MFFVVFGILQADTNPALMAALLVAGAVFLAGFFLHIRARERAGEEALLSTPLFKNRTSNLGLVTQNIQWLLLMGVSFVVAVFLQTVRGYNAIETGVIFTAATVGVLVSSLGRRAVRQAPPAADADHGRVRRRRVAGSCVLIALVGASSRVVAFAPGLLLIGLGLGVMLTPSVNLVQSSFPERPAGRDLRAVPQRLEPRLVVRHGDRRDDPRLGPRLREHVLRPRDGRARRAGARRPRRRRRPPPRPGAAADSGGRVPLDTAAQRA